MTGLAKKTALAAGGVLVVLAIVAVVFFIRMKSETGRMTPLETGMVIDGVYAVKDDFVNFYIVRGKGGYIAFDSGNGPAGVVEGLKKLSIDNVMIKAVFLTHGDSDHAGGLAAFKNAKIYISEAEEQMVNGATGRFGFIRNAKLPAHENLADGHVVEIAGLHVRGVLTPGHTPGSMCYLVDGKWMFAGDTMSLKDGKAGLFNDFFNMDSDLQQKSLRDIVAKQMMHYIFTGHYGYTGNPAGALAAFEK